MKNTNPVRDAFRAAQGIEPCGDRPITPAKRIDMTAPPTILEHRFTVETPNRERQDFEWQPYGLRRALATVQQDARYNTTITVRCLVRSFDGSREGWSSAEPIQVRNKTSRTLESAMYTAACEAAAPYQQEIA